MENFIRDMPKAELHVHLEGTLEPDLRFKIARRNGLSLLYSAPDELSSTYQFSDVGSFLKAYYQGIQVLHTEQDFYDLAYTYLDRAHQDNVVYSELMFDPQAHTDRGVSFETVIKGIHKAQTQAEKELGIKSQLIMCFIREKSARDARETLERGLDHKDWIAGVGLDSDERGNPPLKFKEVFQRARKEGFQLTAHCGPDVEGVLENIRQCIQDIEVNRIDHGVNAAVDSKLMEDIKARKVPLTTCPIMRRGQTWKGLRHAASIRTLMDAGVKVTVNTDDPAYFMSRYLNQTFVDLQKAIDLSQAGIIQLARNAFEAAWLPQGEQSTFLAQLEEYAAKASQDSR